MSLYISKTFSAQKQATIGIADLNESVLNLYRMFVSMFREVFSGTIYAKVCAKVFMSSIACFVLHRRGKEKGVGQWTPHKPYP